MSDFFIRYDSVIVHVRKTSKLWSDYAYTVMYVASDMEFEYMRQKNPYANCVKINLREQLFGKNLRRSLPKKVREAVCDLDEIKSMIRDEKIDRFLSDR